MKNKKQVATVEHVGYDLMPAAVDFFDTFESVGVKYGNNKQSKWWTRDLRDGVHVFYLPDRTLYRGRAGATQSCIASVEVDEFLEYSLLSNPELYSSWGLRYAMISPPHMGFKPAPVRNPHIRLFADSGGFQIRQGVTDFIDPNTLVDFYNKTTDIGIGLDVPMHPLLYPKMLQRMAHVTCMNGEYIKKQLNPGVMLYDLNHGMDLVDRKAFLDVTEKYEPLDGISLAGTSSNARGEYGVSAHIVNGVVGIAYVLARSAKRYRTAHILGTTTPFYMFVFNVMTRGKFFPHITSDSSTYAQAAIMNTHLMGIPGINMLRRNPMPKTDLSTLPCSCPICHMTKYTQSYVINNRSNMIHSIWYYVQMMRYTEHLADEFLAGRTKDLEILKVLGPSTFSPVHMKGTMRFLRDLIEHGYNKAYANSKDFIHSMLGKKTTTNLFGGERSAGVLHGDAERTDRILTSYETYHKKTGVKKRK
ncbi:tRNA guanine transglycosylase [Achromobacter phage Motura]|uniref:tRNA guanine transglycosylase n=1 Tax=Achromobacter phage Motura TaxID=2591403 RepID=A0A514CSI4_9CAUD|nr:tRNA guanine transglycosylase [Achromobacter phage Motura]QDH83434.1 tRNA guanine transglycosylase [Achromobacter phage Motura]